jgi:hypothetical protein
MTRPLLPFFFFFFRFRSTGRSSSLSSAFGGVAARAGGGAIASCPDHTTSLTFGGELMPDSTTSNAPGFGLTFPPFGASWASSTGTCSPTGGDFGFFTFAGFTTSGAVSRIGAGTTVNTWRHSRFGQRIDFPDISAWRVKRVSQCGHTTTIDDTATPGNDELTRPFGESVL